MQFAFWQLIAFMVVVIPDLGNAIYNRYIRENHGGQVRTFYYFVIYTSAVNLI